MMRRILAIALLIFVCAIAVWAGSTAALSCGTSADVAIGGGKAWGSPTTACGGIGSSAALAITAGGITDYLAATNYGFAVPGGATILGVQVTFKRSGNTAVDITDNVIVLTKNGTVAVGVDHSNGAFWPNTPAAFQTYGAINDTWSAALAPADVNAATFGVLISAQNNNSTNLRSATVYASPTITVTYSSQATGFSPGFIGTIVRTAASTNTF